MKTVTLNRLILAAWLIYVGVACIGMVGQTPSSQEAYTLNAALQAWFVICTSSALGWYAAAPPRNKP